MRAVIAVACALLALAASARADEATITIASGTLQGTVNFAANTRDFLGIPFAQPPVGALRWADPLPNLPWNGVLNATAFGIGCIQQCNLPPGTCPWGTSEDCLTLNVFTPRAANIAGPLPVMFFIPGGRFEQGASGTSLYAGDVLANSTNTVVVTTNYRLGLFGFMASTTIAGSYGIKDQRLALQWVQQNIAAFGGDPTRVTIFGQSAGASSVATHLTTAKSKPLFHQAISQSNPFTLPFHTPAEAEKLTNQVCAKVGCGDSDIECLRAVDAATLLAAAISVENALNISNLPATFYPWTPIVDGVDITDQPVVLLNTSAFNAVPLIIGNVEQEALMFVWEADSKNLTDVEYVAALALIFKDDYSEVHSMYPANHWIWEDGDNRPVLANLSTSYLFMCPSRMVARNFVRHGMPVYSYHFNHAMSFDGWGPNFPFCVGEVCHGVELPFLFESISELGFQFTADEQVMATSLTTAWGNFAHTGNPNLPTPLELQWPAYSVEMDQILEFATPGNSVSQAFKAAECDLWDSVGYVTGNIPSQLLRARQLLKAQKIHLKI